MSYIRTSALAEPDVSLWKKLRYLMVAGSGLFGDGFLNITIGLVVPQLGYLYFADNKNSIATVPADLIKGGLALGMICGQLGFGLFGDAIGRHRVYGKELLMTIIGTFCVIVMPWGNFSHNGVVAWMTVFRVVTGIGIGGDYPMTSSISAERGLNVSRAKLVLSVFTCLGIGAFSAALIYIILLAGFKSSLEAGDTEKLQYVWRLLFGLGLVPLFATVYARFTIKETKSYENFVAKKDEHRGLSKQFEDFRVYFGRPRHATALFGVCASWFLFDIAFYGINLNQAVVLDQIGYGKGATMYESLWNTAVGNIIVSAAGYLPGYFIGIFLPDWIGRVRQQFLTSLVVALLYAIWAGVSGHTSTGGLITLFTLSQLFLNMGPNCTTFLLPVEVFPTRVRGSAHGIAAASGKAGAVLTAFAFGTVKNKIGLDGVLGLFSGIMALCALVTLLIPETKGFSIAEIEQGLHYGRKNGLLSAKRSDPPASSSSDSGEMSAEAAVEAPKRKNFGVREKAREV